MIQRFIESKIFDSLESQKVVIIFGPRRVGKTVLLEKIRERLSNKKVLMVAGDSLDVAEILSSQRLDKLKDFIQDNEYLLIDEAQKIPNIGINLKLIVDHIKNTKVLVTGSSSFDLRRQIGEPLVGRAYYFYLYPISQLEFKEHEDYITAQSNLESRLLYGSYPQVITAENKDKKREILDLIRNGYLLKDVLELDNIKDSLFIFNLLKLIAFQIGNDISYSELANNLNVDNKTVVRYLELLEKTFVIFSLHPLHRNLRKEIAKAPRYYFWDNGIRNSIISNFNPINSRDDIGKLWENYCQIERLKKSSYTKLYANRYFWRTYDKKEIDLIEEKGGKFYAFEIKWRKNKIQVPKEFLETYPNSEYQVITQENYLDFIT